MRNEQPTNILFQVCNMEADKARAIKEAYWEAAQYMGVTLTPRQYQMYCEDLIDEAPVDRIVQALKSLRREPSRRRWGVPQPSEILEYLYPRENQDSRANAVAAEIIRNIQPVGYSRPLLAEQRLSPPAWRVVIESGGWVSLCQRLREDNLTTERAQLRDLARSILRREEIAQRVAEHKPMLTRAPEPVVPLEPKPANILAAPDVSVPWTDDELEVNKKRVAAIISAISGRA